MTNVRAPEMDLDLFTEESLRAPFDDYRRLRDTAPVVRFRRPEVVSGGRFSDVQAALRAPEALISGEGVGFSDSFYASRERMLAWAAATFNLVGLDQDGRDLETLAEARAFMADLTEETIREGSWAAELFAATRSVANDVH